MVAQAQDVILRVAELAELHQGVLQAAGRGDGLLQHGRVLAEIDAGLVGVGVHLGQVAVHQDDLDGREVAVSAAAQVCDDVLNIALDLLGISGRKKFNVGI